MSHEVSDRSLKLWPATTLSRYECVSLRTRKVATCAVTAKRRNRMRKMEGRRRIRRRTKMTMRKENEEEEEGEGEG